MDGSVRADPFFSADLSFPGFVSIPSYLKLFLVHDEMICYLLRGLQVDHVSRPKASGWDSCTHRSAPGPYHYFLDRRQKIAEYGQEDFLLTPEPHQSMSKRRGG